MYRSLIAAAFAVTAMTAPALAATDTFQMEIAFTRAKLATVEGASAEYAKIRGQVVERCEAEFPAKGAARFLSVRACTERTLSNAIRQINHPVLSEVHSKRS